MSIINEKNGQRIKAKTKARKYFLAFLQFRQNILNKHYVTSNVACSRKKIYNCKNYYNNNVLGQVEM